MAVVKHIWVLTSLSGQDLVFKAVSPPAYLKINWDCLDSHVSKTKTHLPLSLFFTSAETRICCILAWFTYSSGVSKCSPVVHFSHSRERKEHEWVFVICLCKYFPECVGSSSKISTWKPKRGVVAKTPMFFHLHCERDMWDPSEGNFYKSSLFAMPSSMLDVCVTWS